MRHEHTPHAEKRAGPSGRARRLACVVLAAGLALLLTAPEVFGDAPVAQTVASAAAIPGDSTWVWENPSPTGNDLTAVSCPSPSTCFAVGRGLSGNLFAAGNPSAIVATTNGGRTWTMQDFGQSESISCPSATTCFAVGSGAGTLRNIVATTDGGKTWTTQTPLPVPGDLHGVSCPSAATCFAVGSDPSTINNQLIIATTNGGSTWTTQTSASTNTLTAISCPSSNTCFAVGEAGGIVATTNGGSTWTTQISGIVQTLYAVSCPGASTCLAVGEAGTILATVDGGTTWNGQSAPGIVDDSVGSAAQAPAPASPWAESERSWRPPTVASPGRQ